MLVSSDHKVYWTMLQGNVHRIFPHIPFPSTLVVSTPSLAAFLLAKTSSKLQSGGCVSLPPTRTCAACADNILIPRIPFHAVLPSGHTLLRR